MTDKALEAARAAYEHHQDTAMDQQHSSVSAYIDALEASLQAMQARAEKAERERDEAEEAENEAKDCFWAIYPKYLEMGGEPIDTEAARTDLAKRAEAAEARVKELEEALEPFVPIYEPWMDKHADNVGLGFYRPATFGDLRRARTALKGGSNG